MANIDLLNVVKYYKGLPHQEDSIKWLQKNIPQDVLEEFADRWRNEKGSILVDEQDDIKPVFFSQIDNHYIGSYLAHRSCNSSAHAMVVEQLKPGILGGDDREYVEKIYSGKYGYKGHRNPSIYWSTHTKLMAEYGIKSVVNSNGDWDGMMAQVDKGIYTATNLLHRGHISNPRGGHVTVIVANLGDKIRVHDPYLYYNLIPGTHDHSKSGIYECTKKNFKRRWQGTYRQILSY